MKTDYDILIIGGGMVGATLARAIAGHGVRIAVIEPYPAGSDDQPSYDDRAIALAYGARRILEALDIWPRLENDAAAIRRIHISDRGHFGFTRLDHADEDVEALGYVLTARTLGRALIEALDFSQDVDFLCPARLQSFENRDERVFVAVATDEGIRHLSCRLLVAADGFRSLVRERLGIQAREWRYGQTAVIANITPRQDHRGVAYERFTDTGPMAMLPMTQGRCALVWTLKDEQVPDVIGLDDTRFLEQLQKRFGYRLGRLEKAGLRSAYPLRFMLAKEHVRSRVALIGNAAHTLHPVAGQGFNLGIRDVAVLAELLVETARLGGDPGGWDLLQRYAKWRRSDQQAMGLVTDGLARLFSNPLVSVSVVRNLGMLALDLLPGSKHLMARRFMGLSGRLPRLARGLSL